MIKTIKAIIITLILATLAVGHIAVQLNGNADPIDYPQVRKEFGTILHKYILRDDF
jgi:hypothetical protein